MNNSLENLYKKGSNESTPTALDSLILNAAKQSCKQSTAKTRPRQWLYLLSTAAVLVMGVNVVFNLQNENAEMKVSPESINTSIDTNVLKEDLRTEMVAAPPLEPHPRPQKNRKRVSSDKINKTRVLGRVMAQKPTMQLKQGLSITQIENESQAVLEKVLPIVAKEEVKVKSKYFEKSQGNLSKVSEDIVVVGERRATQPVPELKQETAQRPQTSEITQLEILISANKYKQAKTLLEQLQSLYPYYDWSRYKEILRK